MSKTTMHIYIRHVRQSLRISVESDGMCGEGGRPTSSVEDRSRHPSVCSLRVEVPWCSYCQGEKEKVSAAVQLSAFDGESRMVWEPERRAVHTVPCSIARYFEHVGVSLSLNHGRRSTVKALQVVWVWVW